MFCKLFDRKLAMLEKNLLPTSLFIITVCFVGHLYLHEFKFCVSSR